MRGVKEQRKDMGAIDGMQGLPQHDHRNAGYRDQDEDHAVERIGLGIGPVCQRGKAVGCFKRHRHARRSLRGMGEDQCCRLARFQRQRRNRLWVGDGPGTEGASG